MPTSLRVIVTQGHRNTSGGNSAEQARIPALANAVTTALNQAGHEATCLQNDDGSADNWFAGSLDAVARRVMAYHQQRAVDLLLDIHIESDPANTPGVFAIVPNGTGLKTLTPFGGTDRADPASRNYRLGREIARAVSRTTGLRLRAQTVLEPGVMSEQATHVASDLGWRLAMFGYTAPARDRMDRLVLECGNLIADAATLNRPDFARLVAEGVVAGIERASGAGEPDGFPAFGTMGKLPEARLATVTASMLRIRKYAETTQPTMATLALGSEFPVCGWIIGENVAGNPVWWLTGTGDAASPSWRMWSGGTDLAGAGVLALPTR